MTKEQLIQGFIREAELTDPNVAEATTYERRAEHVQNVEAYAGEIRRRNELATFIPLLNSTDIWVAFCTADRLVGFDETVNCAMATLDRIAADERSGIASGFARRTRNMVRFGDPAGAFKPATERERAFLRVVPADMQRLSFRCKRAWSLNGTASFSPSASSMGRR